MVRLVENEQVDALVRAMLEHFADWAACRCWRGDRPKVIALSWTKRGTVTESSR